ncbi:hypothetical protein [Streptomyces dioscori]|uniref:hypothetical protein n=1 Tax=Streptomyces dioscori TaxID=2109333 RepID=UPI00131DAC95|nr:hypothetical protein [Streptomyces dioscori]
MTSREPHRTDRTDTSRRTVLALGTAAAATPLLGTYEQASRARRPPTYRPADVGF